MRRKVLIPRFTFTDTLKGRSTDAPISKKTDDPYIREKKKKTTKCRGTRIMGNVDRCKKADQRHPD